MLSFTTDTLDYDVIMTELMFTTSTLACANITIVDDESVESNESFLLILHTTDQTVRIEPDHALITILDDDDDRVPQISAKVMGEFYHFRMSKL